MNQANLDHIKLLKSLKNSAHNKITEIDLPEPFHDAISGLRIHEEELVGGKLFSQQLKLVYNDVILYSSNDLVLKKRVNQLCLLSGRVVEVLKGEEIGSEEDPDGELSGGDDFEIEEDGESDSDESELEIVDEHLEGAEIADSLPAETTTKPGGKK